MEKDLSGKEVAIVALGASFSDYVLSRINSTEYAEVWGINSIGAHASAHIRVYRHVEVFHQHFAICRWGQVYLNEFKIFMAGHA